MHKPIPKEVTFAEVLADPISAKMDTLPSAQAFLAREMVQNVTAENFTQIVDYTLRPDYPAALGIFVMMTMVTNNLSLCDLPAFVKWAKQNKDLLI